MARFNLDMSARTAATTVLSQWGKLEATKKASVFSEEDIRVIVEHFAAEDDGLQLQLMFLIGIYGAMRKRELAALTMSDVECLPDASAFRINIEERKSLSKGETFEFIVRFMFTVHSCIASYNECASSRRCTKHINHSHSRHEASNSYGT